MVKKTEVSNNTFHDLIEKGLNGVVPPVKGDYKNIFTKSQNLTTIWSGNSEDLKIFKELFSVKPRSGYGNGEVSLFWLFNYKDPTKARTNPRATIGSKQPGVEADLTIDGKNVEVKSYTGSKNSLIKLGMWTGVDNGDVQKMLETLFAVDKLINKSEAASVRAFDFNDIKRAADNLCIVRQSFAELDPKDREKMGKFSFFKEISSSIKDFDEDLKKKNLRECFTQKGRRVGGVVIAASLMKYLITEFFKRKPGPNGYVVNLPGTGGSYSDGRGFEITEVDGKNLTVTNVAKDKAFNTSDLNLFLNFDKLFK